MPASNDFVDVEQELKDLVSEAIAQQYPSVSAFCREHGFYKSDVSRWVNGKQGIGLIRFLEYARALNIKIRLDKKSGLIILE